MPNYNYRSNDYMRRNQYQRTAPAAPIRTVCECTASEEETTARMCMHDPLNGLPVAMAYVPWQEWRNLYAAEKALHRGTIFEDLDKPFSGKGGCCK